MKTNPSVQRRGVALVIVLVFVVLLSVFVLSFFSNSQNELSAAQSFSGEISAQQLGETATSVVMSQIREATSRPGTAWASEPGMIRTYGDSERNTPSDQADALFKLYSSDDMIVGRKEFDDFLGKLNDPKMVGGEYPIDPKGKSGWDSKPALFTDLNAPIVMSEPPAGADENAPLAIKFPIIDGHDIKSLKLPDLPAVPKTETGRRVLTYDATNESGRSEADNIPDIEGFAVDPALVTYDQTKPLSPSNTPVPMPVKWLYVLRDGTMTAPTKAEIDPTSQLASRAVWEQGQRGPTKDNPIVGRLAFWADDDTCKVNINTAGGFNKKDVDVSKYPDSLYAGSFWDAPRTKTAFDMGATDTLTGKLTLGGLSVTQPVAKEYQRYPGHPATTSLGLLFKDLLNSEQLYSILPRLAKGGTENGTERFFADESDLSDPEEGVETTKPLVPKRERIFASVDEFLFAPRENENTQYRPTNFQRLKKEFKGEAPKTEVSPELLERMRFFLTAHSRAPELNLYGRPRVTIWPSYPDPERLNASDRLLNFCSIIGPRTRSDGSTVPPGDLKLFEYQRSDPYSPTMDWDRTEPSARKYDQPNTRMPLMPNGETRNQFIHHYLQQLTDKPVPGVGGKSFAQKYGGKYPGEDRDQILTEIFDYMRCVNMRDSTRDKEISPENPKDPPAAKFPKVESYKFAPLGIAVPIEIKGKDGTTRGFGRFPTISEATLVFYHTGYRCAAVGRNPPKVFLSLDKLNEYVNTTIKPTPKPLVKGREYVTHDMISAFMIFETFSPMMGYAPTRNLNSKSEDRVRFIMEVQGLDKLTVQGTGSGSVDGEGNLKFMADAKNHFISSSGGATGGRNVGGSEGFFHLLRGNWASNAKPYPMSVPHKWGTVRSTNPADHYYQFQGETPGIAIKSPAVKIPAPDDPSYYKYLDPVDKTYDKDGNATAWQKLKLIGATLDVKIYFGHDKKIISGGVPVRSLKIKFPDAEFPMPTDHIWRDDPGGFAVDPADLAAAKTARWYAANPDINPEGVKRFGDRLLAPNPRTGDKGTPDKNNNSQTGWNFGGVFANGGTNNDDSNPPAPAKPGFNNARRFRGLLQPGDSVRSVILGEQGDDFRVAAMNDDASIKLYNPAPGYTEGRVRHSDTLRLGVGNPVYGYVSSTTTVDGDFMKYGIKDLDNTQKTFGEMVSLKGVAGNPKYELARSADIPGNRSGGYKGIDGVRSSVGAPARNVGPPGDFDTGLGDLPDGAYTGKADEGNPVYKYWHSIPLPEGGTSGYWIYPRPYFTSSYEETFDTFFTPNRQTPSAVVFGSLPSGKNAHWTTLCFSPVPASDMVLKYNSKTPVHPGLRTGYPRDHYLLDLFNMPIVEPYAISEPFSTAGKVNMNYEMMPFRHIERSTALRAVLHSVRVTAFPKNDAASYKNNGDLSPQRAFIYRYPLNRDLTLRPFRDFFDLFKKDVNAGFFKSATEICDRALYPRETPAEPIRVGGPIKYTAPGYNADPDYFLKTTFWTQNALTGDNMREKPYSDLYPRLTTKSNTYTVHVRAQSLRQTVQSAADGVWDEKKDRLIGEYRGSSTIERFIDPEDARFDPKSKVREEDKIDVDKESVEKAYRFRVINTKRFVP